MNDPQTGKADLRRRARRGHAALDGWRVEQHSAAIFSHLQGLSVWSDTRVLHTYVDSLPGEVATREVIEAAATAGVRVLVPIVEALDQPLRHAQIDGLRDLQVSSRGLLQPTCPHFVEDLSVIDLVLVPGLLFDRRGYRVGQGGGLYDRFLARVGGAITVGLTYDDFIIDRIPDEDHDIPVHLVITPSGVYTPPAKGR
jgi:5-formyltetrahydrofolate cyclo-ligase